MNKFSFAIWASLFAGVLGACDMMEGLYDGTVGGEDEEVADTAANMGTVVDGVKSGQYCIDATSYTKWIYVNLHGDSITMTCSVINIEDSTETGAPELWDYAQHHYDVKTNGAEVMMTPFHSIEEMEAAMESGEWTADGGLWVGDEWSEESVVVDMSHMLEGYLDYVPGYVNREAGRWLNVDLGTMPPIYTMHDNVLLLRLGDGSRAAIQLVDYMSADRRHTKGWMTVNYKYPI